jgi:heme exporter protein A
LWLLDEPFTNLDAGGSALLAELLAGHIVGGGMAIVVAHHALDVAVPTRRLELDA